VYCTIDSEGHVTGCKKTFAYSALPQGVFGWADFVLGSFSGLYITVNNRARDYDCFGKMMYTGNSLVDFHRYFDEAWPNEALDWALLGTKFGMDVYNIVSTVLVCKDQLSYSQETNWLDSFTTATTDTSASSTTLATSSETESAAGRAHIAAKDDNTESISLLRTN